MKKYKTGVDQKGKAGRDTKPLISQPLEIPTTIKNQERVQRKRHQIILAAIKLFSENGFHKSTLRDLARVSGISHGNIYDYVASKEDIFFLIHQHIADLIDKEISDVIEGIDDPLEKLRNMVRCEFNFINEWEDAVLLLYREAHVVKGEYLRKILQRERDHISRYETVIEECIKRGMICDCNVRIAANIIKCSMDSVALRRWDLRKYASREEMAEFFLAYVFNGIAGRYSTQTKQ